MDFAGSENLKRLQYIDIRADIQDRRRHVHHGSQPQIWNQKKASTHRKIQTRGRVDEDQIGKAPLI